MKRRAKQSTIDYKALTLRKMRRHCRSPGTKQIIRSANADIKLMKIKQRPVGEEAIPARLEIGRHPMLSAIRCKRSIQNMQKVLMRHTAAADAITTTENREDHFQCIAGCILSGPSEHKKGPNKVDPVCQRLPSTTTIPRSDYDNQTTTKPGAYSISSEYKSDTLHPVDLSDVECELEDNIDDEFSNEMRLISENSVALQKGLNPTCLLQINPLLRTISSKIRHLQSLIDRQSQIVSESQVLDTSDNESMDEMITRSDNASPMFKRRLSDDIVMSDVVNSRPSCTPPPRHGIFDCNNSVEDDLHVCSGRFLNSPVEIDNSPFFRDFVAPCHTSLHSGDFTNGMNSLQYRSPSRVLARSPSTPTRFLYTIDETARMPFYEELNILPPECDSDISFLHPSSIDASVPSP